MKLDAAARTIPRRRPPTGRDRSAIVPIALLLLAFGLALSACDTETAAWEMARQEDTAEAYERFLQEHPGGPHAEAANRVLAERRDDDAWAGATAGDTIADMEGYLENYPEGRHVAAARERLASLSEERDWANALHESSIEALEGFVSAYPDSDHAGEAERLLAPLREAKEWSEASADPSVDALERFVDRFPQSEHRPAAERLLEGLRWQAARDAHTPNAYASFLARYPESEWAGEARIRLDEARWGVELLHAGDVTSDDGGLSSTLAAGVFDVARHDEGGTLRCDASAVHAVRTDGTREPLVAFIIVSVGDGVQGTVEGLYYSGGVTVGDTRYRLNASGPPYLGKLKISLLDGGLSIRGGRAAASPGSVIRGTYKPASDGTPFPPDDHLHVTTFVWETPPPQQTATSSALFLALYGQDLGSGGLDLQCPAGASVRVGLLFRAAAHELQSVELLGRSIDLHAP